MNELRIKLEKVLKAKYGIETMAQLDKAIRDNPLHIEIFVNPIKNE